MIYLDNAATSFPKPPIVLEEVFRCINEYCGNPGRSSHELALMSAERVFESRERVSELLHFPYPERVVFTQNATHALNYAIKGLINQGDHVITSDIEHNSVLRPLYSLESKGIIELSTFDSDLPLEDAIEPLLRENTRYLVMSIASNVTGKTIPLNEIVSVCKKFSLHSIIDASQLIGHRAIDWVETPFDVICAPGHKALFGIQGSGFVAFSKDFDPETIIEGGSGTNSLEFKMPDFLPERLEAGTVNTPAIVSLGSGISYLMSLGLDFVEEKIDMLTSKLAEIVHSLPLVVYGCNNGICSFTHLTKDVYEISNRLSKAGICTRSGIHCAPMIHRKLGIDKTGSIRISLSIFNDIEDLDSLYYTLKDI